jgi:hypothetical protein
VIRILKIALLFAQMALLLVYAKETHDFIYQAF